LADPDPAVLVIDDTQLVETQQLSSYPFHGRCEEQLDELRRQQSIEWAFHRADRNPLRDELDQI